MRRMFLWVGLGCLLACHGKSAPNAPSGPPPTVDSVTLTPDGPTRASTLTCAYSGLRDASGQTASVLFTWFLRSGSGHTPLSGSDATRTASDLHPGDQVFCEVTPVDALATGTPVDSATLTLVDQSPQLGGATVRASDARPTRSSTLSCETSGTLDPDGDPLTATYQWYVNGTLVFGFSESTFDHAFIKGDVVSCAASVTDGWTSASATSAGLRILSTLPTIDAVTVSGPGICAPYTCTASGVQDADGDAVTVHYQWSVNGTPVGTDDAQLAPGPVTEGATVTCYAYADDGTVEDGVALHGPQVSASPLTGVREPATVTAALSPISAYAGDTLTCTATLHDDCGGDPGPVTVTWSVNGASTQTDSVTATSGIATDALNTAGRVHAGDQVSCAASLSAGASAASGTVTLDPKIWNLTADVAGASAGTSVAVVDDLNHDGYRELAIGAPNTSPDGANHAGAFYLVHGAAAETTSLGEVIDGGVGGVYQPGDRGSFQVATMACNSKITYVGGCPKIQGVGNDSADIAGPDGAGLGFAMAYAGDLDGDGVGDLVVSAPYDQVGPIWTGRTWVLSGVRLGSHPFDAAIAQQGGFTFDGECGRRRELDLETSRSTGSNGDLAGWRVIPIGDANGDGLADFAVSAPNNGDFDEGTVYVVFGRTDGKQVVASDLFQRGCDLEAKSALGPLSGKAGYAAYGPTQAQTADAPPQWGRLIAPAGDINGDGYDDFIVQTHGPDDGFNDAFVFLGGKSPTPQQIGVVNPASEWAIALGDFECSGSGGSSLTCHGLLAAGFPVGGGGDVNGDGYDDVAFEGQHVENNGFLQVLYGGPSATGKLSLENAVDGGTQGFEVTGTGIWHDSESGVVRVVPDLNGDGYDDVVLGVPAQDGGSGGVYVVFGAATPPKNLNLTKLRAGTGGFAIEPGIAGEHFGQSIATGDIDGDGLEDLVIGAPSATGPNGEANAGRVQVVFGRDFTKNRITFRGTPGDDAYTGTSSAESIVGGRGNDTLIGGGGADVLYGGAGDDTLQVDDDGFRRVNGGPGEDTLVLGAGVTQLTLDGTHRRRVQDVEHVTLSGQVVHLSKIGLVSTAGVHHRLTFSGTGSIALATSDHWKKTGTAVGDDGVHYVTLADGQAQLWIGAGLTSTIPPTVFDGPLAVPENAAQGSTVATLTATDPDGDDSQLVWHLVQDDSGAFAVDSRGAVTVANPAPLDFEAGLFPWHLVVDVTDGSGLTTRATFTVSLTDQPEPPQFVTVNPVWSANEDAVGVLGTVSAIDPDVGDTVTYSISSDPSGLFQIDPSTGEVSLQSGKGLDYEQQAQHAIGITATDSTGRTAQTTVQLDVVDLSQLSVDTTVTFRLKGWSIWQDSLNSAFNGQVFGEFTSGQVQTNCAGAAQGSADYAETWLAHYLNGPGPSSMPVEFDATTTGQVCTTATVHYNGGTFNATVPVRVHLQYPDSIHAGDTIELDAGIEPQTDGAALWGMSTGLQLKWGFNFQAFGIRLGLCEHLMGTQCDTVVDNLNNPVTGSYNGGIGSAPKPWTAPAAFDSDGQLRFATTQPVTVSQNDTMIDWNDMLYTAMSLLGLPSNTGSYDATFFGTDFRLNYTLINTQVGYAEASAWDFGLDVNHVNGTLTFEDGSSVPINLYGSNSIQVPAGADVNGDGKVDVSISLSLDSTFHNTWNHSQAMGYQYELGEGSMKVYDSLGNVQTHRWFGPAYKQDCVPKLSGDSSVAINPARCIDTQTLTHFDFTPTGFDHPSIEGALQLAP